MKLLLKLYVTGHTPNSVIAFANLKKICEEELIDDYEIKVIDILKEPELAEKDKIIATPTLVKILPTPIRKVIGNLSDKEKVLYGLDLMLKGK